MTNRFYDLTFNREPDGSIYLEQHCGIDDPVSIFVHPAQLRHICESFGLVAPNYPADELSKRLAEQLCRVFLAMCDDYRHLSHALKDEYASLDGFISALPDAVFPHHLWEEREVLVTARTKAQDSELLAGNVEETTSANGAPTSQQIELEV